MIDIVNKIIDIIKYITIGSVGIAITLFIIPYIVGKLIYNSGNTATDMGLGFITILLTIGVLGMAYLMGHLFEECYKDISRKISQWK